MILRILLTVLFFITGGMKLVGGTEAVETFNQLGFGQWFRVFVGIFEIAGAAALLLGPLAPVAALGLAALMVGALFSHLLVLGPSPVPAMIALVLCLAVAWIQRADLKALPILRTGKRPIDG